MTAEYNGQTYIAEWEDFEITLMTYQKSKCTKEFRKKRDYFITEISTNDPRLTDLYRLYHYVRYKDSVEDKDLWLVDEDYPTWSKSEIEKGLVAIDVPHDPKDDSWTTYEKGAAAKVINLADCQEFLIEKIHAFTQDFKIVSVSREAWVVSIIKNRRKNL